MKFPLTWKNTSVFFPPTSAVLIWKMELFGFLKAVDKQHELFCDYDYVNGKGLVSR